MGTKIKTKFTEMMGVDLPIIAGPMFLVSNETLVSAVSSAGGIGAMPSLNWRSSDEFRAAVRAVRAATDKPFAVNIIVNKANPRVDRDLEICVEEKVPMIITSLGNPKTVIEKMHAIGSKVFCDVTTLEYAKKVEDLGADGVIAVSAGAGGHAGPVSPLVLVPYLVENLRIPVVAAGGIAKGNQMLAALVLGASAVQIGTRFIASNEAKVSDEYKQAILGAKPEDIVLTKKISGTPASVIKTPYVENEGTELNFIENFLHKNPSTKKYMKLMRNLLGARILNKAASSTTWKQLWSAGQGVGLIEDVLPVRTIIDNLLSEFEAAKKNLP